MSEYKCEICGTECEDEMELEIKHRSCRLKAAFPGAYTERGEGLVTFDMKKVAESLGLFNDIVIGRDGQPLHPLEGDLHFRIGAGWLEPEIWIELPVQVGNQLSSFAYRLREKDWLNLVNEVGKALKAARAHLELKKASLTLNAWRENEMKGILFKPDMIKAIVEGRKTVTRRMINPQPQWLTSAWYWRHPRYDNGDGVHYFHSVQISPSVLEAMTPCARYQVGEVVYIKEAWCGDCHEGQAVCYKLDSGCDKAKWRSPLFLKGLFARYFIRIKDVRAERLQEITEEDARAEGIERHTDSGNNIFWYEIAGDYHGNTQSVKPIEAYAKLWDSINKDHPWKSNCWVWRYEFELVSSPAQPLDKGVH